MVSRSVHLAWLSIFGTYFEFSEPGVVVRWVWGSGFGKMSTLLVFCFDFDFATKNGWTINIRSDLEWINMESPAVCSGKCG